MDTIMWIIVVGLPVTMLIYLFGWLVGFNSSQQTTNWGTGFDDGWKAHKRITEEIMKAKQNEERSNQPESGD